MSLKKKYTFYFVNGCYSSIETTKKEFDEISNVMKKSNSIISYLDPNDNYNGVMFYADKVTHITIEDI